MTVKELKDFLMNYPDDKIIDIMIEDIKPAAKLHMALAPLEYKGELNDGHLFLGGYDYYKGENK